MKKTTLLICALLVLVSCSNAPSQDAIQTAIAKTQEALPTSTSLPTNTPTPIPSPTLVPTETPKPSVTPFPTREDTPTRTATIMSDFSRTATVEYAQLSISELISKYLKTQVFIKSVNLVRFRSGELQIEYVAQYIPEDKIIGDHYTQVKWIADLLKDFNDNGIRVLAGGDFKLVVTTLPFGAGNKYQSISSFDTITKVRKSQISYDEWKKESNAGYLK
jgi:hypothetical protein